MPVIICTKCNEMDQEHDDYQCGQISLKSEHQFAVLSQKYGIHKNCKNEH